MSNDHFATGPNVRAFRAARRAILLSCLFAAALVSGCAHRWDMVLTNGARVTNISKPKREGDVYVYKDVAGNVRHISAGRVLDIGPHTEKNSVAGSLQE
jgi:hypothetical protein